MVATSGPIAAALGVLPDEVRPVRSMFITAALLGLSLVFFYGGANALFLTRFDSDSLAWVYLANGLVTILIGIFYGAAGRRWGATRLLIGSGIIMAASILGMWGWSVVADGDAVAFALATWFRVLFIFAVLGLWELASAMFDVRQSKRVLPAIALGVMLAFMVGGGATGLVAAAVGTPGLVLVAAAFMAAHTASLVVLLRKPDVAEAVAESSQEVPAGPAEILGNRFARRLGEMRTVTILLIYLTEFVFYQQAAAAFTNEDDLAGFLGGFLAINTFIMVIVAGVIAGRYISRFGVRVGLATYPFGVGLVAIVGGLWGTFVGTTGFFFPIATVVYGLGQVLANGIETPVGALMFQPLPAARRMPIRVAVDGWLGSVALILVSIVLLIVQALPTNAAAPLMWVIVAVSAWGVYLASVLFDHYRRLLREATTVGFRDRGESGRQIGFGVLPTITRLLDDGHDDDADSSSAIIDALGRNEPDLVEIGVRAAEHHVLSGGTDAGLVTALRSVAGRGDLAVELRTDAVFALADRDVAAARSLASQHGLASASLVLALNSSDPESAEVELVRWASSSDPDERERAGRALRSVAATSPTVAQSLCALIGDSDPKVALAALDAACHHPSTAATTASLEAGRRRRLRTATTKTLQHAAGDDLDLILEAIPAVDGDYGAALTAQVVPALTRRPTVINAFVQRAATAKARAAGFAAIRRADIMAPASIQRMIRDDVEVAAAAVGAWRDLAALDDQPMVRLLRLALVDEYTHRRRVVLAALRIDHDADRIDDIETILGRTSRGALVDSDRANAIEGLDVLLAPPLKRIVVPLLEPPTIIDAVRDGHVIDDPQPPDQRLTTLASDERFAPLVRRLADAADPATGNPATINDGDDMTELIDRVLALRAVDIFAGLPIEIATELAERATERTVAEGESILVAGSVGRELYAVIEGSADVMNDGGVAAQLEAGTIVGELALLDPAPRNATVTATSPCRVLVIERDTLLDLAEQRPQVMVEIARVLAGRLRADGASQV